MTKRLPYPTLPLKVRNGDTVEEYIIPECDKEKLLKAFWLWAGPPPSLDEERYDLHEQKIFKVKDFKIIREIYWTGEYMNFLVSPYFPTSNGTVVDWMPPEFEDEDNIEIYSSEDDDEMKNIIKMRNRETRIHKIKMMKAKLRRGTIERRK